MIRMMKWLCFSLLLLCAAAQDELPPDFDWDTLTALDEYVHSDDGFWEWHQIAQYELNGVDVYVLNMTSQKWMDETYSVDCTYWWHYVMIAVPQGEVRYADHASFLITGGNRNQVVPDPDNNTIFSLISFMANDTRTIVTAITNVPLQPCMFQNDWKTDRSEDSLIAWTWRTAIDDPTRNPEQVARLPFTKAAKRGLDTVTDFLRTLDNPFEVNNFYVGGASKRGWTTWSLAAVDTRVKIIFPLVFSLLHAYDTLQSHFRAMGGAWSFALGPYYEEDLTYHLLDPDIDWIFDLEDMIRYRSRLTMPKLLVAATGDEFFLNQDSHHWWDIMPEPMYMMMNPNAEHALFPHYVRIYETVASFYLNYHQNNPMPVLSWERHQTGNGGFITLDVDEVMPISTRGLHAETLTNDTTWRRDFRLAAGSPPSAHPVRWYQEPVQELGAGQYRYDVDQSEDETLWVGHFIEAEFEGPEDYRMFLTTEVNIVHDTFPVEPCTNGEECYGYLV